MEEDARMGDCTRIVAGLEVKLSSPDSILAPTRRHKRLSRRTGAQRNCAVLLPFCILNTSLLIIRLRSKKPRLQARGPGKATKKPKR